MRFFVGELCKEEKMKYHYAVDEETKKDLSLGDYNYTYEIESCWDEGDEVEYVAQDAAEEYHNDHDGWESSWPCDFTIWNESGKNLGTFTVEREFDPTFSANRKGDKNE